MNMQLNQPPQARSPRATMNKREPRRRRRAPTRFCSSWAQQTGRMKATQPPARRSDLVLMLVAALSAFFGAVVGTFVLHMYYQSHVVPPQVAQERPALSPMLVSRPATYLRDQSLPTFVSSQCDALIDQYVSGNRSLTHKRLKVRAEIPAMLNEMGLLGQAVEVGVRDGDHSFWILSNWRGKMLHMVDPWIQQDSKLYNDVSNRDQGGQDQLFNLVKSRMEASFPTRHTLHRDFSVQIAQKLLGERAARGEPPEMFDFVYLDARHDYDGIKEDMEAWWPLLKVGGLFAGHDFVEDGLNKAGMFGVQRAVKEFVDARGKEVMSISDKGLHGGRKEPRQKVDGGWTTWYFFK